MLLCLYGYLSDSETLENRRHQAVSFFSGIFLASAIAKLNPSFLSGAEFLPGGDFVSFQLTKMTLSPAYASTLAWITIAFEILLGILVWILPFITIQLGLLFILCLSFLHPHVFFVYFCFVPFFLEFQNKWSEKFKFLENPFFWFFLIVITKGGEGWSYSWVTGIFAVTTMIFHLRLVRISPQIFRMSFTRVKNFLPLAMVMLTVVLRFMGAPAPFGYSMFSGNYVRNDLYQLESTDPKFCQFLRNHFKPLKVTEVEYFELDHSCNVRLPTESGTSYIKKVICLHQSASRWKYRKKNSSVFIGEDCASFGK